MFHIYKSKFQFKDLIIKIKMLRILEKKSKRQGIRSMGKERP